MVLTAEGAVADPRPGLAAAAAVRASLAALEQEGREDAAACCAALWRLHRCAEDERLGVRAGLSSAGPGGGVAGAAVLAACEALSLWRDDYEVCWAACELLAELLRCCEQGRAIAMSCGAAGRLANALAAHHGSARRRRAGMEARGDGRPFPQVALGGCRALHALLRQHRDGGQSAAHVAAHGGAEAVVAALRTAALMEEQVAAMALGALVEMLPVDAADLDGSDDNAAVARGAVLEAGAVAACVSAMRGLARSVEVSAAGIRLLGTLATMGGAEEREAAVVSIVQAGGAEAIAMALLAHPRTNEADGRPSGTHYFGCWALFSLSEEDGTGRAGRVLARQSVGRVLTAEGRLSGVQEEIQALREKHAANRALAAWSAALLDVAAESWQAGRAGGSRGSAARGPEAEMAYQTVSFGGTTGTFWMTGRD